MRDTRLGTRLLSGAVAAVCACVLLVVLVAPSVWGQDVLANAVLVGHWTFDEGAGQTAKDSGEVANHAVLGGEIERNEDDPQWVAEGKMGACLRFDGQGDRVTVRDRPALRPIEGLMVEAWIMQTERTPYARVVDKGMSFDIYVHEQGWVSLRTHGAEAYGVHSSEPIPLNEWVKVRGEIYGGRMRLLVNDEPVAERAYDEAMVSAGGDLIIGNADRGRPFCGMPS